MTLHDAVDDVLHNGKELFTLSQIAKHLAEHGEVGMAEALTRRIAMLEERWLEEALGWVKPAS